jgi:hypothetical protein
MQKALWIAAGLCLVCTSVSSPRADLKPDRIHVADAKKNDFYIRDGLVIGGDKAIDQVVVKDIRRASNPAGFERVVIDIDGNRDGEPAAISRPPYYQVSVTPDERRLVFTVWGHPKLAFNSKKINASFKKSKVFKGIDLLPTVEDDSWTFSIEMRSLRPVEVFELGDPARVIIDVKTGK